MPKMSLEEHRRRGAEYARNARLVNPEKYRAAGRRSQQKKHQSVKGARRAELLALSAALSLLGLRVVVADLARRESLRKAAHALACREGRAIKIKMREDARPWHKAALGLRKLETKQRNREWHLNNYHENQAGPRAAAKRLASLERAFRHVLQAGPIRRAAAEAKAAAQAVLKATSEDRKIQSKLADRVRKRLKCAVDGKLLTPTRVLVGTSLAGLKAHLESLWLPGMTWDNHSLTGWHIDHIKPMTAFDLRDPAQILAVSHYLNLQPLWAEDNIAKSNNYTPSPIPEQVSCALGDNTPSGGSGHS